MNGKPRPGAKPARAHTWTFKSRLRRHAFGWRASRLAIERINEAVAEIRKLARTDPVMAAEGAVVLVERLSPALEHVDSSSGALGAAVNRTIAAVVPFVATAPADRETHDAWLDRLWTAHEADEVPYIETLADYWGDLCASSDVASAWADRLLPATRLALGTSRTERPFFHGTSACLSALAASARFGELLELLETETIWPYKRWGVHALVALGRKADAIRYAEACRGPWTDGHSVDEMCEEILLSSGLADEAYRRYGLRAYPAGSYAAVFRAVTKTYPHKAATDVLDDLVATTPGSEGKWFAAAKAAGFLDKAIELARRGTTDPKTLARAARDFVGLEPEFALEAGLLALEGLVRGHGYEITGADVLTTHVASVAAAKQLDRVSDVRRRIEQIVRQDGSGAEFVRQVLGLTRDAP